jgi:hypothetical protein
MRHVYGVVRPGHPTRIRGIDGASVEVVACGPVAAAVSDLERELAPEDAHAHLDVLIGLLDDGPVLPVRFGTAAPDDDAVRAEVLAPSAQLAPRLDALDGMVELHVDAPDGVDLTALRALSADVADRAGGGCAYLVRRDDLARFDRAVDRLGEPLIRYVGPLPPAHFVEARADSFTASEGWGF